ncbi:MAG: glycosyltransferase family 9 protein, partial [Ignavibacteriales bacterium]|nr:glycosyltransferase family 9 protein [Ignavibacteriales bacterium]
PGQPFVSSWEILESTRIFSDVMFFTAGLHGWKRQSHFARLSSKIRELNAERLFYLAPNPRTTCQIFRDRFFFRVVCGIPRCYGLKATDDWVGQRDDYGNPVTRPSEALRLLQVVEEATTNGRSNGHLRFDLPVTDREKAKVEAFWRESKLNPCGFTIAFGLGSKMPSKIWPLERYIQLAKRLLQQFSSSTMMVVGGSDDLERSESFCKEVGANAVSAAGRFSVLESAEALRRCSLYVGNDTGVMHLAAAIGTPCVAIASARSYPGMWDPSGQHNVVLRKNVPCAGCLLSACEEHALVCLTTISVSEAYNTCLSALGRDDNVNYVKHRESSPTTKH